MINERKLVKRWFREGSLERKRVWTMRCVWEPYIGKFKDRGESKLFGWRREVARIFISPLGKEYVRRGPSDPLHRTLCFEGLRDVQLTRLSESRVGQLLAKREREDRAERQRQKRGARR